MLLPLYKVHWWELRNAVRRLSPAGPPPTQTTSKISGLGFAMVAYFLALALIDLAQDRQILDRMAVTPLGVLIVPVSGVMEGHARRRGLVNCILDFRSLTWTRRVVG